MSYSLKPKRKKIRIGSLILRLLMWASAAVTAIALIFILAYILIKGVPYLSSAGLFAWEYNSNNVSLVPALLNTLILTLLALGISVPLGIGAAIYLVEYAKKGNRLVSIIRVMSETLTGIPSIVYGLFGMLFFVIFLGWNYSILAGATTVAIMVLPVVMRTTEEALMSVPDGFREGSFALGAGKLRTIFLIVLPTAIPGILSGIILSIGRIVGETAALMYTAGTVPDMVGSVMDSGRTLSVHMYTISNEGFHTNQAFAAAVVLLILVFIINGLASLVARVLTKNR